MKKEIFKNKFFVLNEKYFEILSPELKLQFFNFLQNLDKEMPCLKDKHYYVCNIDEPYSNKIIKIILAGENKKTKALLRGKNK
jgi:hypothetical protein